MEISFKNHERHITYFVVLRVFDRKLTVLRSNKPYPVRNNLFKTLSPIYDEIMGTASTILIIDNLRWLDSQHNMCYPIFSNFLTRLIKYAVVACTQILNAKLVIHMVTAKHCSIVLVLELRIISEMHPCFSMVTYPLMCGEQVNSF